jgi:hypothetical protein
MAPKRSHGGSSRGARELNRAEEWVESVTTKAALNRLVVDGVLPDRETARWRPAAGEDFPTPGGDELVVFEGYFYRGFGSPVHPFLSSLIDYYGINLCNLGPIPSFMLRSSSISMRRIWAFCRTLISFTISSVLKPLGEPDLGLWGVFICSSGMGWRHSISPPR